MFLFSIIIFVSVFYHTHTYIVIFRLPCFVESVDISHWKMQPVLLDHCCVEKLSSN